MAHSVWLRTVLGFLIAPISPGLLAETASLATADLRRVLLVRADGSVIGQTSVFKHFGESFTSIRVLPGDAIVIPAKLQSGGFSKALRDWALLASQASIAAAVIATH